MNIENKDIVSFEQEMKTSFLDYAMSVIVSRAIPDVRDGLKPVHRRILYSMYEGGYSYNKPHRKSARIVGDVIGKYHPHGDVAVYDSLVRMAQDFSLRVPLVDGQGNFGSIDGDPAAAMRYTESRLTKIAQGLLNDIDKNTIEFIPNYDGSENEPTVLPAIFPNILVNGSGGIAVGMATNIPPHNLSEVIDACCLYVDDENIDISDLMSVVQGPDFPTGGTIIGNAGIASAYSTGKGSVLIRGKVEVEEIGNKQAIIITEVPYMVNKAKLVEKIAELVRDKKIEGISDLRDESNKSGIRVVIELKKDAIAEVVQNQLYSYTPLQTTFSINMLALDHGMPKVMNLKEIVVSFVKFRENIITNRTICLLNKARDRSHILVGLRIAVSNIDEVIRIIKSASDSNDAKLKLMQKSWKLDSIVDLIRLVDDRALFVGDNEFKLTDTQAKAILEMRLQRLTAMEKNKIEEDLAALAKEIAEYIEILNSRTKLLSILKDELLQVKEEFGTPRLTSIEIDYSSYTEEDLIKREDMVVTVTLSGYIKRVPLVTYRTQKRGGKGRSGLSMKDEDVTTQIFVGSTHTPMLFFSNMGQVYSLKLYKLPLGTPQSKGRYMSNILPLRQEECITNIMPLPENITDWDDLGIMFATSQGNIRRNDLSDFKNIQSNGKIAIRLDEGDSLVNVLVCNEEDDVLLATKYGKALRFPVSAVRVFKSRTSTGVRAIKLAQNDIVISMTMIKGVKYSLDDRRSYLTIPLAKRLEISSGSDFDVKDFSITLTHDLIKEMAINEQFILTVTENGFGKRSSAYEYRITNRGGSGIINIDISEKTGNVVSVMHANSADEIMLITDTGKLIRCNLDAVRITGRSTSGVILFKTSENEKVVSVSKIADSDENDNLTDNDSEEDMINNSSSDDDISEN